MNHKYDATEFLKKLNGGTLRNPLSFEGFVKPLEKSDIAFFFSLGTSCKNWIKIPAEMIENVEFLSEQSCDTHTHPLVRIQLKEMDAADSTAAVFS